MKNVTLEIFRCFELKEKCARAFGSEFIHMSLKGDLSKTQSHHLAHFIFDAALRRSDNSIIALCEHLIIMLGIDSVALMRLLIDYWFVCLNWHF